MKMKKARKSKRKSPRKRIIATPKPYYVTDLENQIASLSSRVADLERAVPAATALDMLRQALRALARG
jgi:hypothetical protein